MNSNILENPKHPQREDQQSPPEDLDIQYEVFQIRKHQIESSLSYQSEEDQTQDLQENAKHQNDCDIEDDTFHDCKQIDDCDLTSLKSFQWTRTEPEARNFHTTKDKGPDWNKVYRRTTINNTNNEIVQDLTIDRKIDIVKLSGPLPPGVTHTTTIFFYHDSYENLNKDVSESHNINLSYQFNTNSH